MFDLFYITVKTLRVRNSYQDPNCNCYGRPDRKDVWHVLMSQFHSCFTCYLLLIEFYYLTNKVYCSRSLLPNFSLEISREWVKIWYCCNLNNYNWRVTHNWMPSWIFQIHLLIPFTLVRRDCKQKVSFQGCHCATHSSLI